MQLQATLSRLAAFAFFLLSFSMLVCAAPAPVPAPGALAAGGPGESGNSLVARGGNDVGDQCHKALLVLKANVDIEILKLNTCYNTPGCDYKPIVLAIIGHINACVAILLGLQGVIVVNLSLIVSLVVALIVDIATACGKWAPKLGATLYIQIFGSVDVALCALLNALVKLSAGILLKIKLLLILKVHLLITACFNGVIKLCGLPM